MFIYSNTRTRASQKKFAEKERVETMNKEAKNGGAPPRAPPKGLFVKSPFGIRKNFDK